jgi:hypothetical protein
MKKVKAMLAGIAVVAVIGGVFAFKAKSAFGTNIWYTTKATFVGAACDIPLSNSTAVAPTPVQVGYYYTTVADLDPCVHVTGTFQSHN